MRNFSKPMKNIQHCQTENKPESTKVNQRVEIPKNSVSAMGFPNKHKYIGDMISAKIENDQRHGSAKIHIVTTVMIYSEDLCEGSEGSDASLSPVKWFRLR